jgi:hypothetical protein
LRLTFFGMPASIEFDREARALAVEVEDVTADRVLPAELHTAKASAPELPPERGFGSGWDAAKLAGTIDGDRTAVSDH